MASIHETAVVDPRAEIGVDVFIGPLCVVGPDVRLGDRVRLESHVAIAGSTTVGAETQVFPFASIGHAPQDLKFQGEESRLEIGARNTIREYVTLQPGTEGGGLLTKTGDDCLFMACAHIAHDCVLGNNVILANNVMLAGHCVVGDYAFFGGGSGIHQFVRIGAHAFIGGMSGVENNVIPFGSVIGNRASLAGLNIIGLKRRGFAREQIHALRNAYKMIFATEGTLAERAEAAGKAFEGEPIVGELVRFILENSDRAICTPRTSREGG